MFENSAQQALETLGKAIGSQPPLAQFDADTVSALSPESRASFEKSLRDSGYSQADIDARLPPKPTPAPDDRPNIAKAWDQSKLSGPKSADEYRFSANALANPDATIAEAASLKGDLTNAFTALQLPPMLAQSLTELIGQAEREYAACRSDFERSQYLNKQAGLIDHVANRRSPDGAKLAADIRTNAKLALDAIRQASPKLADRIASSRAADSAQVQMMLALQVARLKLRSEMVRK